MGDLRNKFMKLEEEARIQVMQRRMERGPAAAPEHRCQCGLTYHQVDVMWAYQKDPQEFYCLACLPSELRSPEANCTRPIRGIKP